MASSLRTSRLSPYNGTPKDEKDANTTPQHVRPPQNDGHLRAPPRRRRMLRRSNLVTPTLNKASTYIEHQGENEMEEDKEQQEQPRILPKARRSGAKSGAGSRAKGTRVESVVIRKGRSPVVDEYDYKTFSTGRPLRLSKVRAFEQAELTMRKFFQNGDEEEGDEDFAANIGDAGAGAGANAGVGGYEYVKNSRWVGKNLSVNAGHLRRTKRRVNGSVARITGGGSFSESKASDEVLVQLPGLSKRETLAMVRPESAYEDAKGYRPATQRQQQQRSLFEDYDNGDDEYGIDATGGPFVSAERRLAAMRRALKPVPEDLLVDQRLRGSRLPQVFQNTGEFLRDLDVQEMEYWEALNEEFEDEVEAVRQDRNRAHGAEANEAGEEELRFLDAPFDALYGKEIDRELLSAVVGDIRRKAKDALQGDELDIVVDDSDGGIV